MAKSRLQICLPDDPFYDLKENRTPVRNGTQHTASPGKPLKTPKSSRSKDRRLECLQWALDTAQEQQIALLEGARTQLEDALGQVSHLQGQLAQTQGQLARTEGQLARTEGQLAHMQGQLAQSDGQLAQLREQLAYVADCRHSELCTSQAEVAKLKSKNVGLLHENRALAAMTSDYKTECEAKIDELVLKHAIQRHQYESDCAHREKAVALARDEALAEVRKLTASLESVREGLRGLEAERDKLRKEVAGLEGLRNERNGAVESVRALRADLSAAQQRLKKLAHVNRLMTQEMKWDDKCLQHSRTQLEAVRTERDGLQGELEREKTARADAAEKFEKAESARARARKDMEAAIGRLVESQRARSALQHKVAQGLEALAGAEKLRECEQKAYQENVAGLEDEARRLRAALQMPPPRFGVSERPSASSVVTSAAAEKNVSGEVGAGVSGQSAAAVRPAQQGFGGFGGALESRNVNTFSREAEGGGVSPAQSAQVAAPGFVFGSADNHPGPGIRRNSLSGRRKVLVTKKAGAKTEIGDSNRADKPAAISTDGSSGATKLSGLQGLGRTVSGFSDADKSVKSDVSHVGGSEASEGLNSQQESATCTQKNGPQTAGLQTERDGKAGSGVSNLKKVMGCFKKHLPAGLQFGRAVNPMEERRVWGLRRTAAPQLQTGRLRRKNARRLAAEVHLLIGLMVQLERCGVEIGP